MEATIWWWILWILISDYPWPWGQLKIKTKPFNIFLLQINRSINSLSMTTIISNRSIGLRLAFPGLTCQLGSCREVTFCLLFPPLPLNLFCLFLLLWNAIFSSCCHINISCFSSPLSLLVKRAGDLLKILLYLFQASSSAGRTIDSSSFSFFKFPVVLLRRSALRENRKGRLMYVKAKYGTDMDSSCLCVIFDTQQNHQLEISRIFKKEEEEEEKGSEGSSNFGSMLEIFSLPLWLESVY